MNINYQAINDLVDAFMKYNAMTADDARKLAILNIVLKEKLANGAVKFTFRKGDGTIRTAYGTNKDTIVPNFYQFKGTNRKENPSIQRYFDLERGAFRCFTKANLISIAA